jgi:probable F420-dependent oxidoreductase
VRYGLTLFLTDTSIDVVTLGRAAEERGFVSLYLPEHTHIPTSRRTPAPAGEPLAEEYKRSLDPFVAMTAAATVTETLRVGTGIALVAQRDPIVMAKEVASLDHLSGGRVTLGIGFGWNREEMADHGVDYTRRREVVAEHVAAMRVLWSDEQAGFDGEFVSFEPSFAWPKPVQRPHPPILLGGGAGPKLFEAIAAYGDGWLPIGGAGVREALPRLHAAVEAAGRDPTAMTVIPFGVVPDPGKVAYYEEVGFAEVVLRLPSAPADVVLPLLDEYAGSLLG